MQPDNTQTSTYSYVRRPRVLRRLPVLRDAAEWNTPTLFYINIIVVVVAVVVVVKHLLSCNACIVFRDGVQQHTKLLAHDECLTSFFFHEVVSRRELDFCPFLGQGHVCL